MSIKAILDEIANESSTNKKMDILKKYSEDLVLQKVLYLAYSKRIKFYVKQIPIYETYDIPATTLENALNNLEKLSNRELTGHAGINFLFNLLSVLSADDAIIIERIIGKDLKIGMATKNISKVIPNLLEVTPYMGAQPFDIKKVKKFCNDNSIFYADVKMDGQYQNSIIRDGDVECESRQGETNIFDGAEFVKELSMFPDMVLNGELTLSDEPNRIIANGIIGSVIDISSKITERKPEETAKKIAEFEKKHKRTWVDTLNNIVYTVWDCISVDEYYNKASDQPYNLRWETLKRIIDDKKPRLIKLVEKVELHSFEELMTYFQQCINRGLEGCILKSMTGKWKNGKPSWQFKLKLEMSIDLKIVGFNYGTKGTKNENVISSLKCVSSDGLLTAEPGGMDEETMQYVTDSQDNLLNTIVEVKCNGITQSNGKYSVLHPRIGENRFRSDKIEADSYEQILAIENMCKGLTE